MQQTINNLKERPKEDRVAVAGGIAGVLVVIIFLIWGYVTLKRVSQGQPIETDWGPREDIIDLSSMKEATDNFNKQYYNAQDELKQIRDTAARAELDRMQGNINAGKSNSDVFLDPRSEGGTSDSANTFGL